MNALIQSPRATLLLNLVVAWVLTYVPYIHLPLEWYDTTFHELSHGLAAILTGGSARRIELNVDGSGTMWTAGGWRFAVSFAGYAGTFVWGTLIYLAASALDGHRARWIALFLAGTVALSLMLWASYIDVATLGIGIGIAGSFALIARYAEGWAGRALRLIGMYVFVSGMASPTYLLATTSRHSDAATLRGLTGIPELVWIGLWLVIGVAALALLWRLLGAFKRPA